MQHIDSDLIRGNIDTIILKTMLKEDKYGLDIIKEVGEKSSGTYELKQPTLYSCLKRLENQELISSYWVDSDIGGRRHYYKLTDKGRDFYNKKQEEWAKSKFIIDNLLSNYDYEEYRLVKKDEFDEILKQKANTPLSNFENNAEEIVEEDSQDDSITENSSDVEPESSDNNEESEDDIPEKYRVEIVEDDDEEYGTYYRNQTPSFDDEDEIENDDEDEEDFSNEETIDDNSIEEQLTSDDEFDEELSNIETIEDLESYLSENQTTEVEDAGEEDVFNLGEDSSEDFENDVFEESEDVQVAEDNDYPVYFSANKQEPTQREVNTISYETNNQSANELNILSRLRGQDEEINTYYGDKKSYVNHLNQIDESKLEQQDLLDNSLYVRPDLVNKSIDDFTDAIDRLNNFGLESSQSEEDFEESDETDEPVEEIQEEQKPVQMHNYNDDTDDDLEELNKLKNLSSNAFFYSNDETNYQEVQKSPEQSLSYGETEDEYEPENYDFGEVNTYQTFEQISNEIEPRHEEFNDEYSIETIESDTTPFENNYHEESVCENPFDDIDSIISNNITTTYPEPTQHFYKTTQSVNYRDKLSDLSKYSKVSLDEEKTEVSNTEAIEKAKDIAEITKELEEEGIRIKEHYKSTSQKHLEKNYLLSNKINLIKSLIMLFGYVFVLSAVYIVLNNTAMKNNSWFSIKPFLIGFIPFGILFAYQGILFAINPYKKVDAKYHARIMFFISIIITIQLLLITYCVNLQLGFYSFSQKGYNHLFWIVPTIISFAPIIDNLVYLALYKSKNFNV